MREAEDLYNHETLIRRGELNWYTDDSETVKKEVQAWYERVLKSAHSHNFEEEYYHFPGRNELNIEVCEDNIQRSICTYSTTLKAKGALGCPNTEKKPVIFC